jgi:hypothetical protein
MEQPMLNQNDRDNQLPPDRLGDRLDNQFFRDHPDRDYHIRVPIYKEGEPDEFALAFRSLGPHEKDRRRVIVRRLEPAKVAMFGIKYLPIPFLLFADESIEDTDKVLAPIFDGIMKEAAADLR